MKKSLLFVAALLMSAMSFAQVIEILPDTKEGSKAAFISSYSNDAREFTAGGVAFEQVACKYNGEGSPKIKVDDADVEPAKQTIIQLRRFQEGGNPAGSIRNTEELDLETIGIVQVKDGQKAFKLSVGAKADELAEVSLPTPVESKESIKLKEDAGNADIDVLVFNVNIAAGMKFFKIENVDNNIVNLLYIGIEAGTTSLLDNSVMAPKAVKMIENGQIVIVRDGIRYNMMGQVIE